VQHMPAGFTQSFAQRLNGHSAMAVTEAVDGETLGPGRAVIARGDTHLVVRPAANGWRVHYTHQRPVNRHCPSVDVLFESVAKIGRQRAVGLLLTGMGSDGARGLLQMRQAGALTIAQSAKSCVVYGMPKVAVELGAAMYTTAPHEMPGLVLRSLRTRAEVC
jgi:two-component system, chemotaxis family, protein-glutamate methylesterase/glutaminase